MDQNIGLVFTPKGDSSATEESPVDLYFQILRIPYKIGTFHCSIKLNVTTVSPDTKFPEKALDLIVGMNTFLISLNLADPMNPPFKVKSFSKCTKIIMTVCVEITKIFDDNGELVDAEQWCKYGVIDK